VFAGRPMKGIIQLTNKNIHAVPADDNEPNDEPLEISLENVRYSDAEYTHGDIETSRVQTTIRVRKPVNEKEFFRLHPGRDYQMSASLYTPVEAEDLRSEPYLVLEPFRGYFTAKALTPVTLRLAINSLDTLFLWDIKRPRRDERKSDYHISLEDAEAAAETNWTKLVWNGPNRSYDLEPAEDDLGDPEFGDKPLVHWIKLAFRDRVVNKGNHPLIRDFKGKQREK
jgi:hypothetical protein